MMNKKERLVEGTLTVTFEDSSTDELVMKIRDLVAAKKRAESTLRECLGTLSIPQNHKFVHELMRPHVDRWNRSAGITAVEWEAWEQAPTLGWPEDFGG